MKMRKTFYRQYDSLPNEKIKECSSLNMKITSEQYKPLHQHQQNKAKQILIRFDQERNITNKYYDPGAIQGWSEMGKENINYKLGTGLKKEIKKHQRVKKKNQFGTHNNQTNIIEQTNTKATISYLKEMLAYLRTSSDTNRNSKSLSCKNNKSSLPSIRHGQIPVDRSHASTILMKVDEDNSLNNSKQIEKPCLKETVPSDKDIIDQLINGIHKLPVLTPSNRNNSLPKRNRKKSKFTLNALLS